MKYNKINLKTPDLMRFLPFVFIIPYGHTSATLLINLGIDIATVAERLGHAQNSTTLNFYTHAISSADKVAAEKLGERLNVR